MELQIAKTYKKPKIINFERQKGALQVKEPNSPLNIVTVPVEAVVVKREKGFDSTALMDLSESIREYGVMQPISVRRLGKGSKGETTYELIAGARRLNAAKMAGLRVIPAVIYDVDENDSAVMSLIDSLQSDSLHFIEEAEAYYFLMMEHGITQEELAYRVGKSQSTIANKIRLLKLPPLVKRIIHDYDLSERHARALLRIRDEQLQLRALKTICCKCFNVSKTEQLVAKLLERQIEAPGEDQFSALEAELSGDSYQVMLCEIKTFINDLRKDVDGLRRAGVITKAVQFDKEDYLEFVVRIPKAENGMKPKKRPENAI